MNLIHGISNHKGWVTDKAFLSPKRLSQTNFPLKNQYRENFGNQSVDMCWNQSVKCNICVGIVVGKFTQNQLLKIENSKSSNAKKAMNYA